ncbi:hypothetical protein IC575_010170 [Cucumis melo]|uniref:Uncharacterized protein LOC103486466 n=1 Tax=Cucumis melo TaxID=3656 RepID=A0A1S3B5Q8_CUCME|nr:uncharacterized protein LOC103486466 [Cucumis melo]
MKPSAKPISSPGRTEKFPPPLMRFLRSNVGSKSRGRSRASPMMFMRRKTNATAIETQEPSSPKVTCIGQVRVRRATTRRRKRSGTPTRRRRCRWTRAALFCPCFRKKFKPNSSPIFQRLVSFFQCGFRRKPKVRTNSPPRETPFHGGVEISNTEIQVVAAVDNDEEEEEETAEALISSNSSPPKNALLLTRCRSAPYRSTSLASRFWGSPLKNEENQEEKEEEKEKEQSTKPNNGGKTVEIEKPTSQRASVSDQDPSGGLEFEEDEEFAKNIDEHSIPERIVTSANIKREKTGEEEEALGSSSRPLILTRCKSEPSRTAEKMNPEVGFWKKRRLGIPDSCLPNNL